MTVRLLSLNAGLLVIAGRLMPAPFVRERLSALPDEIRKIGADIVLLQEVYGNTVRRRLAESLSDLYPYAILPRARRRWGLENGVMTLSRFPASGKTVLFQHAPVDESLLDSKGFLHSVHSLGDGLQLQILNTHTTAGGVFRHPEHKQTDRVRSLQLRQMLDEEKTLPSPVIVCGDFNAGPGVSEENFRQMLERGLLSIHDVVNQATTECTWDPLNSLNARGPHRRCPPQRIDHVFVRERDTESGLVQPVSSEICLHDPIVPTGDGVCVTVSDHYGILVKVLLYPSQIPS